MRRWLYMLWSRTRAMRWFFFPNEVVRKQVKQHRIRLTTVFIMVPFVAFDNHKSQADPLIYYSAWIWRAIKIFFQKCSKAFTSTLFSVNSWHMIPSHSHGHDMMKRFPRMCMATPYLVFVEIRFFFFCSLDFIFTFFQRYPDRLQVDLAEQDRQRTSISREE